MVAQIVKDELRHATVMYGLLADLGFDVDSHVRRHDETFTMRIDERPPTSAPRASPTTSGSTSSTTRSTPGPTSSSSTSAWTAAPGTSSRTCASCSYGPWVRAIEGIFKEEKFHIRHGEYWVKKLAEDPATHAGGPGHVRQVVHPHDEHLRPPGISQEIRSIEATSSSSVTTTRSARRSRRKSPDCARSSGSTSRRGSPSGRSCPKKRRSPASRSAPAVADS